MNTRNDTGFRTFLVGSGGVTRNTRVKISSGTIVTAGAGEDSIGIVLETAAAAAYATVKLWSAPGSFCVTTAGTVVAGAYVYGAAAGQIDDAVAGNKIGVALEADTVGGKDIEILPANVGDLFAAAALIAAFTGTVTGTANDVLEDIAAAAGNCQGGAAPSASQVDTAIATAVAPLVTGLNLQVKEFMTKINAILVALKANGIVLSA